MSAVRTAIPRWFILVVSGWLMSCSGSGSATREEPVLPPNFSLAVEEITQSFSRHESIWPENVPGVSSFTHKVKWQRETLFSIARWYTGSGENWKRLADANPSIKPKQIQVGDTIRIPEHLLKRRNAMPAEFLKPKSSKKKVPLLPRPNPSPESKEMPLYGPIVNDAHPPGNNKNLPLPLETID